MHTLGSHTNSRNTISSFSCFLLRPILLLAMVNFTDRKGRRALREGGEVIDRGGHGWLDLFQKGIHRALLRVYFSLIFSNTRPGSPQGLKGHGDDLGPRLFFPFLEACLMDELNVIHIGERISHVSGGTLSTSYNHSGP